MNCSLAQRTLLRRGEILIGFDAIDNWDAELKRDEQRQGWFEPFHYPNTFSSFTWICQNILSSAI